MTANTGIIEILKMLHQENPWVVIYIYFLLLLLTIEVILILGFFYKLNSRMRSIKKNHLEKDNTLQELIKEYESLLNNYRENIRTDSFIKAYLHKRYNFVLWLSKITKQSDIFFLFLGLLGAFIIILMAVLQLNLDGLQSFEEFFSRIIVLLASLKPALYIFLFSIICAIINNMVYKLWNLEGKIETYKSLLENFLVNELKVQTSTHTYQLEAIDNLINTIENSIVKLEDIIGDTLTESIEDLEEKLCKIINVNNQSPTNLELTPIKNKNNNNNKEDME